MHLLLVTFRSAAVEAAVRREEYQGNKDVMTCAIKPTGC